MRIKRVILIVLIVLLNVVIFKFSSQDGKKSESLSDAVTIKVIDTYAEIKDKEISTPRKNEIIKNTRFIVRKTAHFTVYFLMGMLVYMLLCCYNVNHPILAILICILFASCDEIHQLFSDGRTGKMMDVLIDTYGSMVGMLVVRLFQKVGAKFQKGSV